MIETAEDFFKNNISYSGAGNADFEFGEVIRKYALIKCQELLEIVSEKAETKIQKKSVHGRNRKWQNVKDDEEFDLFSFEMRVSVDKNSILNAVNLDEFIK